MKERKGIITMKGNPLTLIGDEVKVGDKAPEFTVLSNDLSPVSLSSFKNKVIIISSVPSLDTPVCDTETRKFNEEAKKLGPDVVILTISMDLPFAQKRWCGAAGIDAVKTLSDHRDASFGTAYGVLIKELRLLARAVFVVDRGGIIKHAQLVKEITQEPVYNDVLKTVKDLLENNLGEKTMSERLQVYKCDACGNIVEVLHAGAGKLVCCGKEMKLFKENTVDAAKEKHIPVIEKIDKGFKVKVGSVAHPMTAEHYIEWIEIIYKDKVYRQYLKPGDPPEAVFYLDADKVTAREYCNLHGLWKA